MQIGDTVLHLPDGRAGRIVSEMRVTHGAEDAPDEHRFIVQYADVAGNIAQAWFSAEDLAPFTPPTEG